MSYPCIYNEEGECKLYSTVYEHSWCVEGPCDDQTLSNGDRIRSMTDEELAEFLWCFDSDEFAQEELRDGIWILTKRKLEEWLKRPAEGE